MSKPSIPKSLLSAYFDGEVSAEERAAVSRAAQQSPAVQRVLDDYTQLSQGLKTLQADVPALHLWEGVRSEIQSAARPPIQVAPTLLSRRRVRTAGGLLALAAAVFIAIFWTAGPHEQGQSELAQSSNRSVAEKTTANEQSPEEWLTRQIVRNHQIPRPGDVIRYLDQVADETVLIPMTVVDVQKRAGEIRLLLSKHGIQETSAGEFSAEPNVAILVESNWERVSSVMDDLDAQGMAIASTVEASPVAQRALQVREAEPVPQGEATAALAQASADEAAPGAAADAQLRQESGQSSGALAASMEMIHAQLQALVSDDWVKKVEQRQQPLSREAENSAVAEATDLPHDSSGTVSEAGAATAHPKPWDLPYASRGPARFLFLIKKSGKDD